MSDYSKVFILNDYSSGEVKVYSTKEKATKGLAHLMCEYYDHTISEHYTLQDEAKKWIECTEYFDMTRSLMRTMLDDFKAVLAGESYIEDIGCINEETVE